MSAPNRKGMGLEDALLVWMAIGFIVVFGGGTYAAAHLGSWMAGIDAPPAHPIDLAAGLIKGRVPWPTQSTAAAGLMAGLVLVLAIVVLVVGLLLARKSRSGLGRATGRGIVLDQNMPESVRRSRQQPITGPLTAGSRGVGL